MQNEEARQILVDGKCILEGEFIFALKTEPNVSSKYINPDLIFTQPHKVFRLGELLVAAFAGEKYDTLAGPAVGGIPLVFGGANALAREVETVWADKKDGAFVFERMGFDKAIQGKHVLVLEDLASSGDSAKAVCDLIKAHGGKVIGLSCIWNRGGVTAESMGIPRITSLIDEKIQAYRASEHPMWGKWPLVENIGHPEHFPDYKNRIRL